MSLACLGARRCGRNCGRRRERAAARDGSPEEAEKKGGSSGMESIDYDTYIRQGGTNQGERTADLLPSAAMERKLETDGSKGTRPGYSNRERSVPGHKITGGKRSGRGVPCAARCRVIRNRNKPQRKSTPWIDDDHNAFIPHVRGCFHEKKGHSCCYDTSTVPACCARCSSDVYHTIHIKYEYRSLSCVGGDWLDNGCHQSGNQPTGKGW